MSDLNDKESNMKTKNQLPNNDEDVKSNLINENNNLVTELIQFPIQMLKEDNPIDNNYVSKKISNNGFNYKADDQLIAKSEFDREICELKENISMMKENISMIKENISMIKENISIMKDDQLIAKLKSDREICELKEKISILNDQLVAKSKSNEEIANYKKYFELKKKISKPNPSSTNQKKSVTHFLEIKEFYDFCKQNSGEINTLPFKCLGVNFIINIKNSSGYFNFELALLNKLEINKKIKATCELIIINNKQTTNKENMHSILDLVITQKNKMSTCESIPKNSFVHDNGVLKMKVNLTAELTEFAHFF